MTGDAMSNKMCIEVLCPLPKILSNGDVTHADPPSIIPNKYKHLWYKRSFNEQQVFSSNKFFDTKRVVFVDDTAVTVKNKTEREKPRVSDSVLLILAFVIFTLFVIFTTHSGSHIHTITCDQNDGMECKLVYCNEGETLIAERLNEQSIRVYCGDK